MYENLKDLKESYIEHNNISIILDEEEDNENENTKINLSNPFQNKSIQILIDKDENKSSLKITSPEEIYKILERPKIKKIKNLKYIKELFKEKKITKKLIKYMMGNNTRQKRNRCENKSEKKEKKKHGRKCKNDNSPSEHTKESPDNITKATKRILLKYLVKSINSYLEKKGSCYRLLPISGKYGDNIKKEDNIKFLNKSIKEILSLDNKKNKDTQAQDNKNTIDLIEKKSDIPEINYILGLAFIDWIDIFTKKKDMIVNNNFIEFDGFEEMILEIMNKNQENDIVDKIYLMYNYANYFYINRPKTKNE